MMANRVVALCERNLHVLDEDLALIDSGQLNLEMYGADVSQELAKRLRRNRWRLQEIIDGCGCHCV
jgi:hypothetical protein